MFLFLIDWQPIQFHQLSHRVGIQLFPFLLFVFQNTRFNLLLDFFLWWIRLRLRDMDRIHSQLNWLRIVNFHDLIIDLRHNQSLNLYLPGRRRILAKFTIVLLTSQHRAQSPTIHLLHNSTRPFQKLYLIYRLTVRLDQIALRHRRFQLLLHIALKLHDILTW